MGSRQKEECQGLYSPSKFTSGLFPLSGMIAISSPHWGADKINFIADFEQITDKVPVYSIKGIQPPDGDSFMLPISCKEFVMTENNQI